MALPLFGPAAGLSALRRGLLKRLSGLLAGGFLAGPLAALLGRPAQAQPLADDGGQPFLGEVIMGGFNFAPRGYALCDGSVLPISQYLALFSLLGIRFGGDGRTTFALPDLRSRVPIGMGQGPGLSAYQLGQRAGSETVTLTINQLPAHTHSVAYDPALGTLSSPAAAYLASNASGLPQYEATGTGQMLPTLPTGGAQAHNNLQPYLTIGFYIAVEGIYPTRQ